MTRYKLGSFNSAQHGVHWNTVDVVGAAGSYTATAREFPDIAVTASSQNAARDAVFGLICKRLGSVHLTFDVVP